MTEKQKAADKAKVENAEKWGQYFLNGGKMTSEAKKQMAEDRKKLAALSREATEEWLQEKGLR